MNRLISLLDLDLHAYTGESFRFINIGRVGHCKETAVTGQYVDRLKVAPACGCLHDSRNRSLIQAGTSLGLDSSGAKFGGEVGDNLSIEINAKAGNNQNKTQVGKTHRKIKIKAQPLFFKDEGAFSASPPPLTR